MLVLEVEVFAASFAGPVELPDWLDLFDFVMLDWQLHAALEALCAAGLVIDVDLFDFAISNGNDEKSSNCFGFKFGICNKIL